MAFGWAGAAAGANDALQQLLLTAFQQQQQREASTRADAQLELQRSASTRADRQAKLGEAAMALEQLDALGQGAEVSPDVAKLLTDTPYGARVQQQQTLPSRSIPGLGGADISDPGGRQYATLIPTQAQARAQKQRSDLQTFANDPTLPAMMRRWVSARQAGLPIPNPESLETPTERSSRLDVDRQSEYADFTRRADYNAQLQARARRQVAAEAKSAPITGRDRLTAIREADEAVSRALTAMQDDFGQFPEGFDPEALRQQLREDYLATLESRAPRHTSPRVIADDSLRSIVPQPTRTGRITGDFLMPRTPTPATGGASRGPAIGSVRIINGQQAQWDGHGWLAVQ